MEAGGRESKVQEVGKNSRQQESGPSYLQDAALTAWQELFLSPFYRRETEAQGGNRKGSEAAGSPLPSVWEPGLGGGVS